MFYAKISARFGTGVTDRWRCSKRRGKETI